MELAFQSAHLYMKEFKVQQTIDRLIDAIRQESGKAIRITESKEIKTAATIESAENYNRDYHIIKYNPQYPAFEHLIMHELIHVVLQNRARKLNKNMLYVTGEARYRAFLTHFQKSFDKYLANGLGEKDIAKLMEHYYQGLNMQLYNAPIDMLVEDELYQNYPELRPYQFISLNAILQQGIDACTNKKYVSMSPAKILSKSKIMNLVHAYYLRDKFGVDTTDTLKADYYERSMSNKLYEHYQQLATGFDPGDEYGLVDVWGNLLDMQSYYELLSEREFRESQLIKNLKPSEDTKTKQVDGNINPAVVMYLIAAIKAYREMTIIQVREVAYEIALLGRNGINPDDPERNLELNSIPDKKFAGLQILAWMYAGFQLLDPSLDTGLDYRNEYITALKMADIDE
jgi:hypothetical protein